MMTVGEQRHMAVVEKHLGRIATALERIADALVAASDTPSGDCQREEAGDLCHEN